PAHATYRLSALVVCFHTSHSSSCVLLCFFFIDTAPPEIYTLSLHDALPISFHRPMRLRHLQKRRCRCRRGEYKLRPGCSRHLYRSQEHTSELQSLRHLVCRLLLEKKK